MVNKIKLQTRNWENAVLFYFCWSLHHRANVILHQFHHLLEGLMILEFDACSKEKKNCIK